MTKSEIRRCGVLPLLMALVMWIGSAAHAADVHRLGITVWDEAGIQRFGYPVSITLRPDPPVEDVARMRLLREGKPIAAQFSAVPGYASPHRYVVLDFADSLVANTRREYVVEYGPGVSAEGGNEPPRVTVNDETVTVQMSRHIGWTWSRRHPGVLDSVKTVKDEYMAAGSRGLVINDQYRLGGRPERPNKVEVIKDGRFSCAVRFTSRDRIDDDHVIVSTLDMTFVSSKSWARLDWSVHDPDNVVRSLALDLNYHIDGAPTLIDFGSHSYVYLTLEKDETAQMRFVNAPPLAGPWVLSEVWRERNAKRELYFGGRLEPHQAQRPEGWAHLMDQERCVAAALANFAEGPGESLIETTASGRLKLIRRTLIAAPDKNHRVTFWQHLVPMPMHLGAATSPQSMLAPLMVMQRPAAPR